MDSARTAALPAGFRCLFVAPGATPAGRTSQGKATMLEFVRALADLYLPEEWEGQGLVEYALIIVLASIAIILVLPLLGESLNGAFSEITDALTDPADLLEGGDSDSDTDG